MATYSFVGRKILVTGGANGLGKLIVMKFLETGGNVIAVDRDEVGLENLKKEASSQLLITLNLDLTDWDAVTENIEKMLPIHHLVNNAGIAIPKPLLEINQSDIDKQFGVNFKVAFHMSQIFVKGIREYNIEGGTIVNISSVIDRIPAPSYTIYSCSKAALNMLSKCLAAEFGQFGIRSNSIRPDLMNTGMYLNLCKENPELGEAIMKFNQERSKLKKFLEPTDVLGLVLFLCSKDSSLITGVDIPIDGGFSTG